MKMENKNYKFDNKFNICLSGNSNVGKSCYIKRITDNTFHTSYKKTLGIDTHQIHKAQNGKNYLFKVWDISGGTEPQHISNDLYRTIEGFIFTFALNDEQSYEDLKEWIDAIIVKKIQLDTCIVLCLKSDLENEIKVDLNLVRKTCEDYEIELFEVSSKTCKNVFESFESLTKRILRRNSSMSSSDPSSICSEESRSHSGCAIF